jgi:purine-nucleoside phosphorylase
VKLGQKTIWFNVAYGGSMLSEYLHLACLFGSKCNILLGSCGALQKGMDDMDVILPKSAFGDESSTRMYDRRNTSKIHLCDHELHQQFFNKLKSSNGFFGKIHTGRVITCQAMLAESADDVIRWSEEQHLGVNYVGVDMETSTLFAVSKHFQVPAVSILHVSDNLINGEKVGDDSHRKKKELRTELRAKLYQLALKKLLE